MLEERLKITTLEDRLKAEMSAGGGQMCLEMGGTAEALRQAMQHEDRMRAQHELGGMSVGQGISRIMAMSGEAGFESGPASSSGSVPHSPRQQHQEGSPGYSPGSIQPTTEDPTQTEAHYHKEAGGDAVSVYPKEMAETPALVYHKQVGGHSVSIYPKDAYVQAQAAAQAAASMTETSSSYSASTAMTSAPYPGSPLSQTTYPTSPLSSVSLHHAAHSLAQTHAAHSD